MKEEYDLTKLKSRRNPYASRLKRQVTIRMGTDIVTYFKSMSDETGIPYQNLINLYLRDCVEQRRRLDLVWKP
ncbi:MAG TPA: BrnA antitoxin family protein [Candidatus Latescibacteria bacterium]|nr:BrnA antitoxin family protein [Candidatus Latescibacterota bacterium]